MAICFATVAGANKVTVIVSGLKCCKRETILNSSTGCPNAICARKAGSVRSISIGNYCAHSITIFCGTAIYVANKAACRCLAAMGIYRSRTHCKTVLNSASPNLSCKQANSCIAFHFYFGSSYINRTQRKDVLDVTGNPTGKTTDSIVAVACECAGNFKIDNCKIFNSSLKIGIKITEQSNRRMLRIVNGHTKNLVMVAVERTSEHTVIALFQISDRSPFNTVQVDVIHQLEMLTAVLGAVIDTGSQVRQLCTRINLVRVTQGTATTAKTVCDAAIPNVSDVLVCRLLGKNGDGPRAKNTGDHHHGE